MYSYKECWWYYCGSKPVLGASSCDFRFISKLTASREAFALSLSVCKLLISSLKLRLNTTQNCDGMRLSRHFKALIGYPPFQASHGLPAISSLPLVNHHFNPPIGYQPFQASHRRQKKCAEQGILICDPCWVRMSAAIKPSEGWPLHITLGHRMSFNCALYTARYTSVVSPLRDRNTDNWVNCTSHPAMTLSNFNPRV